MLLWDYSFLILIVVVIVVVVDGAEAYPRFAETFRFGLRQRQRQPLSYRFTDNELTQTLNLLTSNAPCIVDVPPYSHKF